MKEGIPLTIKVKSWIKKYAEGVDPKTGTPYEIREGPEVILTGKDAEEYLKAAGVKHGTY